MSKVYKHWTALVLLLAIALAVVPSRQFTHASTVSSINSYYEAGYYASNTLKFSSVQGTFVAPCTTQDRTIGSVLGILIGFGGVNGSSSFRLGVLDDPRDGGVQPIWSNSSTSAIQPHYINNLTIKCGDIVRATLTNSPGTNQVSYQLIDISNSGSITGHTAASAASPDYSHTTWMTVRDFCYGQYSYLTQFSQVSWTDVAAAPGTSGNTHLGRLTNTQMAMTDHNHHITARTSLVGSDLGSFTNTWQAPGSDGSLC